MTERCGCPSCVTGSPAIRSDEHRTYTIARRNGELAAELSEKVRLGLISPEEALEAVRRLGR